MGRYRVENTGFWVKCPKVQVMFRHGFPEAVSNKLT